jgi:alkylated DNA repair dioxygenase AlkB
MNTLFPPIVADLAIPSIPGLAYLPEYVTEAEERELARLIDRQPWNTRWQRRRQPYGASYGKADVTLPIPAWGRRLADRLFAEGVTDVPFDQMLVNEYLPGQGISPHRDYELFGRTVVSLSLLSPCVMDFRHRPSGRQERLLLGRRSLLVMSDDSRYDWEHGIAARKKDTWQGLPVGRGRRLSVTFRYLREHRAADGPAQPS